MTEIKWRFPGNNYAAENGLDTSDMETFRKDPLASLARESCQNSIDARLDASKPVVIEFHSFDLKSNKIPGYEDLLYQIEACRDYRVNNKKDHDALVRMVNNAKRNEIYCLRISDYNTKGLSDVMVLGEESSFYLLTKGSGITNKTGAKGGSKGIGKFASFVTSDFNTVFYSTMNIAGEEGYLGISKLCSGPMPNTDEKTQGIGYYSSDIKNHPVQGQFEIEPHYKRTESGTDIYIFGFKKDKNWKREIVTKVLESFIVAVQKKDLIVSVDGFEISEKNLKDIVYDDQYITKKMRANIISQYLLLTDKTVQETTLNIAGISDVNVKLKVFKKEESDLATNECIMIRYPYMKIRSQKNLAGIPCSAMCLIGDNELNEILRKIENPQHTDWQLNRIEDPDEKAEVRDIIRELQDKITDFVREVIKSDKSTETDIEGAGDYLPEVGQKGDSGNKQEKLTVEKPTIKKRKKNKNKVKIGVTNDPDSEATQPDIGGHDDEGDGSPVPEGHNSGRGGENHDADREKGPKEGDNDILKIVQLAGMNYKYFFVGNKHDGKYVIVFDSLYSVSGCDLQLSYMDDSGTKYKTNIISATMNGKPVSVKAGHIEGFELEEGKKYKFEVETDLTDLYTCEVKIYADR